jgi:hypothetical protein
MRESFIASGLQPDEQMFFYGIYFYTLGNVSFTNNVLANNYCALHFEQVPSSVLIENNIFNENAYLAVSNVGPAWLPAYDNWWGDVTGPNHWSNPGGMGDSVSDYVDFRPYLMTRPNVRRILDPVGGQEISNLSVDTNQPGVELIGFRIDPGAVQVNRMVFGLKSNRPGGETDLFDWGKLSNFRIVEDTNGNGDVDPEETLVVANFYRLIGKENLIEVWFDTAFMSQTDATKGYILLADAAGLGLADAFVVYLLGNESELASGLFESEVTPFTINFPLAKCGSE